MKRIIISLFTLMALLSFQININNTIDFKKIELSMMRTQPLYSLKYPLPGEKIEQTIYACKYEVTNFEYNNFLKYLKNSRQDSLFKICLYDSVQWEQRFKYGKNEPMVKMYGWHPAYNNYPVVNITYEAAVKYCEWLTEQYNNYPKRKFKKVKFHLPTETEWLQAASAWADSYYPWYGNLPYNEKGQFLTNIRQRSYTISSKGTDDYLSDGGIYTVQVNEYTPNKFGLYNIIGNVSEMLIEKGKQKGGNWGSYIEECGVNKTQELEVPDPRVGFRVFMEVIEESKK